jgi:hypothetical protein
MTLYALRAEMMRRLVSHGGRPRVEGTDQRVKIPISDQDWHALESLATSLAAKGFTPSAGQVASVLLNMALQTVACRQNRSATRPACSRSSLRTCPRSNPCCSPSVRIRAKRRTRCGTVILAMLGRHGQDARATRFHGLGSGQLLIDNRLCLRLSTPKRVGWPYRLEAVRVRTSGRAIRTCSRPRRSSSACLCRGMRSQSPS